MYCFLQKLKKFFDESPSVQFKAHDRPFQDEQKPKENLFNQNLKNKFFTNSSLKDFTIFIKNVYKRFKLIELLCA